MLKKSTAKSEAPKPAPRYAILAVKLRSIGFAVEDDDYELLDRLHELLECLLKFDSAARKRSQRNRPKGRPPGEDLRKLLSGVLAGVLKID